MARLEPADGTSVGTLLRGIVRDVETLVREELALVRQEVREDVASLRPLAIEIVIAITALAVGVSLLVVTAGRLVAWAIGWPTWMGSGIAGGVLLLIGLGLLIATRHRRVGENLRRSVSNGRGS